MRDVLGDLDLVVRQTAATPTQQRPPGEPYTNAPRILAIVGALTGVSALLVVLRCYVRTFILRRFNVEDGIMIGSLMCAFGVLACFIAECQHGMGRFSFDIPMADSAKMAEWLWYHAIIIVLGISLVKISIGFFLLRFASQKKALKWGIIGSLIFLVIFTLACIFTLIFQCLPVKAGWDYSLREHAKCYSSNTYLRIGQFNSSINIITDFLFATLPVFMFHNVQVNKRTKASLMGILSLGYFACAAAIVKTVFQSQVFTNPESFRDSDFMIWNCLELNVGIIAASFPTIKPLVKSIIGSTRGMTYGSRSRKRTGTGGAYYAHSYGQSSHAMGSMRRSRIDPEEDKYRVQIRAHHPSISGSDGGSEENLPVHAQTTVLPSSRIIQTTEVIVHSEDSSELHDHHIGAIGPRRTVDDRI